MTPVSSITVAVMLNREVHFSQNTIIGTKGRLVNHLCIASIYGSSDLLITEEDFYLVCDPEMDNGPLLTSLTPIILTAPIGDLPIITDVCSGSTIIDVKPVQYFQPKTFICVEKTERSQSTVCDAIGIRT